MFTPRPLGPLLEIAEAIGDKLQELVVSGARPHEVVTTLKGELQAPEPTILVLEDMHWADEATLDVLKLLARRVETVPALVVASYRDDELDGAHPLRLILGELATSQTIERMKLVGLSPRAVAQLAEPYGADADAVTAEATRGPAHGYVRLSCADHGTRRATAEHEVRPRPRGRRLVRAERARDALA